MNDSGFRLLLLGAPGAGKGTQAELLTKRLDLPHIATGDMFRAAKATGSPMGVMARKYMDRGELVPDKVTIGLVEQRLQEHDVARGWILDGFPRTPVQAAALDELLARLGQKLDAVVKLTVPAEELIRRLTSRRMCPNCTANYNVDSAPPTKEGVCDRCGHALEQREDDSEATVAHRLDVYDKSTRPLIAFYERKGLLHRVDGTQPVEAVQQAIVDAAHAGQVQPT